MSDEIKSGVDIASQLNLSTAKLQELIESAKSNDFSIPEIISLYYEAMNLNSLVSVAQTNTQSLNVQKSQNLIEEFNDTIHQKISIHLDSLIKRLQSQLKSNPLEQKTKEQIQDEAKLYDELRQLMSTKEFIEQYGKGLA